MRVKLAAATWLTLSCLATACKPPATDEMAAREELRQVTMPSAPLESPDTTGAVWADSEETDRLLYGVPGERAMFTLACHQSEEGNRVEYTRLSPADAEAKAVLSLIGNSHVERVQIDAVQTQADQWIWRGSVPADSSDLEPLTGPREVEATVPGAGSLILNPSTKPGLLIARCRGFDAIFTEPLSEPENQEDQQEDPA